MADRATLLERELEEVKYSIECIESLDEYALKLENVQGTKYILSKYRPRQSAVNRVKIEDRNRETLWIVFGFGFGYIVEEILEKCGEEVKILVIEPNQNLLNEQIERLQENPYKDRENITFFSGTSFTDLEELLKRYISFGNVFNISVIEHPHYVAFYLNYYKQVIDRVNEVRAHYVVYQNTYKALAGISIRNLIRNMQCTDRLCDLSYHKNKYQDIPAVIVSAGPSLDKNIRDLQSFEGMIFAVGRALPALHSIEKTADFVGIIDYSDKIVETFPKELDSPLIAFTSANAKVVENAKGPLYLVGNQGVSDRVFDLELEELNFAGSVATLCFSTAHYMGCNPIILIGQDLAYTGMTEYASGCNIFEHNIKEDYKVHKKAYKKIEGYYGEEVLSSNTLISFLRWFEEFIRNNPDREYINATEGGANIAGTIKMSLEEVVKQYPQEEKVNMIHREVVYRGKPFQQALEECLEKAKEAWQLVNKGKQLSKKLEEEYQLHRGTKLKKAAKYLKQLEVVDEAIEDLNMQGLVGDIFQAKLGDIIQDEAYQEAIDEDINNAIRLAKGNYKMYEKLEEAFKEVQIIIEEERERGKENGQLSQTTT